MPCILTKSSALLNTRQQLWNFAVGKFDHSDIPLSILVEKLGGIALYNLQRAEVAEAIKSTLDVLKEEEQNSLASEKKPIQEQETNPTHFHETLFYLSDSAGLDDKGQNDQFEENKQRAEKLGALPWKLCLLELEHELQSEELDLDAIAYLAVLALDYKRREGRIEGPIDA